MEATDPRIEMPNWAPPPPVQPVAPRRTAAEAEREFEDTLGDLVERFNTLPAPAFGDNHFDDESVESVVETSSMNDRPPVAAKAHPARADVPPKHRWPAVLAMAGAMVLGAAATFALMGGAARRPAAEGAGVSSAASPRAPVRSEKPLVRGEQAPAVSAAPRVEPLGGPESAQTPESGRAGETTEPASAGSASTGGVAALKPAATPLNAPVVPSAASALPVAATPSSPTVTPVRAAKKGLAAPPAPRVAAAVPVADVAANPAPALSKPALDARPAARQKIRRAKAHKAKHLRRAAKRKRAVKAKKRVASDWEDPYK